MTIAAGLNLSDWILLFSDTEYTKGNVTYESQKVFAGQNHRSSPIRGFAIAGSVPHARQAVRKIEAAVSKMSLPGTHHEIVDAVESTLQFMYYRLENREDFWHEFGPQFALLMAVWAEDRAALYTSCRDVVTEVNAMEFLGSGEAFGRYIASLPFPSQTWISLREVSLATYV